MIRWPEMALLAAALLTIVIIFVTAWLRRHGTGSATLSPRMFFFIRMALGVVLMLLAVIGAFLPIMQGWIFFLLALVVFFPQSRFAVKVLAKAEPKLPRFVAWLRRWGIGVPPEFIPTEFIPSGEEGRGREGSSVKPR